MLHKIEPERLGPRGQAMADAVGKCVHCGFCLPTCPTYQEVESEMDSPRGRILLMKSVLEGELTQEQARPHIERCLGCLACVTHCPSGVPYGDLISSYRAHSQNSTSARFSLRDWLARQTLPYPARFRLAMRLGKIGQTLRMLVPSSLRPMLDMIPQTLPTAQRLPVITPAVGPRRGRVALLAGCAQQVLAPDINAATVRVLSLNGIEVVVPPGQSCCGALDWHTGNSRSAERFARRLMGSMPKDIDALITTAAGCGSAIHEYPLLLAGDKSLLEAQQISKKSLDISVYLSQVGIRPVPPLRRAIRVAYHDACHLAHAQGVRQPPRELLKLVPKLELVELGDSDTCCGSAGIYNIQQPQLAGKLGLRKARSVIDSGAEIVATGNIGCLAQIENHLREMQQVIPVLHTVQVLDRAYRQVDL
ncbi:MAG: 4Fe-4S dicluster domain-containing protein [Pirellulaceae bacterium]|nr:4Fe-4S dicluster domain-containing protein [Pirellulaceae bacterium]